MSPFFFIVLLLSAGSGTPATAQTRSSAIMGDLAIEDTRERRADPYARNQEQAIEYFQSIQSVIGRLAQGETASFENIPQNVIDHMVWVYLYCTVQSGTCPMVLDAILELDVIHSKQNASPSCPNLTAFWRTWLQNDFEARQRFLVKTGFLSATADFTSRVRPKYIRCAPTVAGETEGAAPAGPFFRARYSGDSLPRREIDKVVRLLDALKSSVPNIRRALDASS